MDKQSLESLLAQGVSVEQIGKRFGKDPSTVSYWMKKYGLLSPYRQKHAAKGGIERAELEALVNSGASIAKIGQKLGRSHATVRHWLAKYGLETRSAVRLRTAKAARSGGLLTMRATCAHHGPTEFWLEGRGAYRCSRCRTEAVSKRRRRVKAILVDEAGGSCAICSYDEWVGALHFHHRDLKKRRLRSRCRHNPLTGTGAERSSQMRPSVL
jgi:transposase